MVNDVTQRSFIDSDEFLISARGGRKENARVTHYPYLDLYIEHESTKQAKLTWLRGLSH